MGLSPKLEWTLANPKWASEINPFLANPINNVSLLKNVNLVTGLNVINHKLGKPLQGWIIVRKRAACSPYDTQDSNQTPQFTLQLTSDANASVDIGVF